MGAFFANIQVYADDKNSTDLRNSIIDFLKSSILKEGYEEVSDDEEADRIIAVAPVCEQPWISIYDKYLESQDTELIDKLAIDLSDYLQLSTIGIMVHDSDLLRITLNKDGSLIDCIKNTYENEKLSGNTKAWDNVIKHGYSHRDLKDSLEKKYTFIEEILNSIAKITNMNLQHCIIGYNYLEHSGLVGVTYLRFKDKKALNTQQNLGPTKFEFLGYSSAFEKKIGEDGEITIGVRNEGISSIGIQIIIKGPAIEIEALKPNYVYIIKNANGDEIQMQGLIRNIISKKNEKLIVIDFPDVNVPQGFKTPPFNKIRNFRKVLEKQYASGFNVKIGFRGVIECESELSVFYLPLSNPLQGQNNHNVSISIKK